MVFRTSLSSSLQSLNSEEIGVSDIALIEGPKKGRYGDVEKAVVTLHLLKGWTRLWNIEFTCGLWADCFKETLQTLMTRAAVTKMEEEHGYGSAAALAKASLRASETFHNLGRELDHDESLRVAGASVKQREELERQVQEANEALKEGLWVIP